MGQYHLTVNLDKREFLDPHKLGDGLKLWEQLNSQGGVMAALHILLACSNGRGGGDLHRTLKRDGVSYEEPEAPEWVGRWAGDRIAVVGDYAEDGDLAPEHNADLVYDLCRAGQEGRADRDERVAHYRKLAQEAREHGGALYGHTAEDYEHKAHRLETLPPYKDISDDVVPLVERACDVRITGEGWRDKTGIRGLRPDTLIMSPETIISPKE